MTKVSTTKASRFLVLAVLVCTVASSAYGSRPRRKAMAISPDFSRRVEYYHNRKRITLQTSERDPSTNQWHKSSNEYSVAFKIRQIAVRTPDQFFVLGRTRTGLDIIEFWSLEPAAGAYVSYRPMLPGGIGNPVASSPTIIFVYDGPLTPIEIQSGSGGGTFIPPDQRAAPSVTKTEIFVGDLGTVESIAADPEGRFLLAVSEDEIKKIVLAIDGSTTTSVMHTTTSVPQLAYDNRLQFMHHATLGRVCSLMCMNEPQGIHRVMFIDSDNDGDFDSQSSYTYDQWLSSGLAGAWAEDFLNY